MICSFNSCPFSKQLIDGLLVKKVLYSSYTLPEDSVNGLKLVVMELRRTNGEVITDILEVPDKAELESLSKDAKINGVPSGMSLGGIVSGMGLSTVIVVLAPQVGLVPEGMAIVGGFLGYLILGISGGLIGHGLGDKNEVEKYKRLFLHLFDSSKRDRQAQAIEIRNGQFHKLVRMLSLNLYKYTE